MYSFNIINCNDKMFYEIVSKKGSISQLIKDISHVIPKKYIHKIIFSQLLYQN